MKRIFLGVSLLISQVIFGQDYIKEISKEACKCVDKVENKEDTEMLKMELGMCIMKSAGPYMDKIQKDFGMTADNAKDTGKKLGQKVGMQMAIDCPDIMLKIGKMYNEANEKKEEKSEEVVPEEGMITGITKEEFIVFTVKNNDNKVQKLHWLSQVECKEDFITNYSKFLNKAVKYTFYSLEIFDAKLGEYRDVKVLSSINLAD